MSPMWNLTIDQWSSVLGSRENPAHVARGLERAGRFVPWSQVLVEETADCLTTVDLGSGRGEHSAVLARAGRTTTLVDWSADNLMFSQGLFDELGLQGQFCRSDITRPLPFASHSIDAVFSCGVFEYFTPAQIDAILAESFRVARKRVIVMVPNARSLAYRLGKWHMERTGAWPWGGEVPSYSLRAQFRKARARNVREYSVGARHALGFLTMRGGGRVAQALTNRLHLTDHPEPSRFSQGYLLVTAGDVATNHENLHLQS
jgi:ubiquinone/menaquinone biosynthesis C-methylase UbiE